MYNNVQQPKTKQNKKKRREREREAKYNVKAKVKLIKQFSIRLTTYDINMKFHID
jgi:hypothetical protein